MFLENFEEGLYIILYIIVLLSIGFILEKVGILNQNRVGILNKIAFYVALPALIFHSIYNRPFRKIFSPPLVLGFCIVIFLTVGIGWLVFKKERDMSRKSISLVQSYHGNIGYMGLPVVTMTLGTGAEASVLLGFGSIAQILLTTILLVYINNADVSVAKEMRKVVLNPVILSLVIGILFSFFHPSIPEVTDQSLAWIKKSALPIALFGVGATIKMRISFDDLKATLSVLGMKMVLMPVLGLLIFSLLDAGWLEVETGVLMLAMPTAISTFIYSKELGGDEELASLNISTTTLASIVSISILLFAFM